MIALPPEQLLNASEAWQSPIHSCILEQENLKSVGQRAQRPGLRNQGLDSIISDYEQRLCYRPVSL